MRCLQSVLCSQLENETVIYEMVLIVVESSLGLYFFGKNFTTVFEKSQYKKNRVMKTSSKCPELLLISSLHKNFRELSVSFLERLKIQKDVTPGDFSK